ncbi:MAG TPA: cell envelope integrity protein CreD [Bacteroidales bacterium]|nr:cell envelope integrity protein CreD [Bacteroidales bacterium]HRZ49108.1 cell envelope integrity protein CreD [Bacteroidales bacterium]
MSSTFKEWIRTSITIKLVIIGTLSLILLIPAGMIRRLVNERKETRDAVISEVSSKWGNSQTITGPVITVPYRKYVKEPGSAGGYVTGYAHFLPDQLDISGNLKPEIRRRNLYQVVLYKSDLQFAGTFAMPDMSGFKIDPEMILWDEAFISVGIPDMRGIKEGLVIQFEGKPLEVNPGVPSRDIMASGVSARLPLEMIESGKPLRFDFTLHINGSESIRFIPMGKTTKVALTSSWQDPSFDGAFLPDDRKLDSKGFSAHWTILHLNRNFPQQWLDDAFAVDEWSFGVNLMFPVDHYQKSERSVKYAIMFIVFTFLTFFFSEILVNKKVHPIQYLLIGFSLCIFYTLLLSLSEQVGFLWAYIIAAAAIISLITAYSSSILKDRKLIALVGFILMALYTFLFTILQIEAYSLLMGSIGLFVVMALIMYLTRKIDWQK